MMGKRLKPGQKITLPQMTYAGTGVVYEDLDFQKRESLRAAGGTLQNRNLRSMGLEAVHWSLGESVFLIRNGDHYLGHVEEGLGTKELVAKSLYRHMNKYANIAQDTVAMIVNDAITLGPLPVSIMMHLAVGDSKWLLEKDRASQLIEGWRRACSLAGCAWGGGETPALKDVVEPGSVVLAGSVLARTPDLRIFNPATIAPGDQIVILESSGIHANGLTMARAIASKLVRIGGKKPGGYFTVVPDCSGRCYGEELLTATHVYSPAIEACFAENIEVHYCINITGHGWRKFMRAKQPLTYVIETLPTRRPIFDFIQEHGPVSDDEAYGNLNMGAGLGLLMSPRNANRFMEVANRSRWPFRAYIAGHIEAGEKRVVIEPKGLEFKGETLQVR